MGIHGFSWVLQGELAGMAMPDGLPEDWEELRRRGVGAIVNLTNRRWPREELKAHGLDYLRLPVGEFRPPGQKQIKVFVSFCEEQIKRGHGVAVHCLAGKGRTGTMIACYLVHTGVGPDEAIGEVRRLRPGSIETWEQEEAVYAYSVIAQEPAES